MILVAAATVFTHGHHRAILATTTDGASLADIVRGAGVAIAVAGAVLAAPAGLALLQRVTWRKVAAAFRWLARHLPWQSSAAPARVDATASAATIMGKTSLSGTAHAWSPRAPEREQIETLRQDLLRLEERVIKGTWDAQEQTEAVRAELLGVIEQVRADAAAITRRLDAEAAREAQLDARALWLVGLGILMTGVPDGLATWTWSGIVTLIVAVAITAAVIGVVIRDLFRVQRQATA